MKIEIDKICAQCGNDFKAKRERKLFCSDLCRATFHQNLKSAKSNISNLAISKAYNNLRELMAKPENKVAKITDATKPNVIKPFEQPKTNFTINTIPEENQHPKFQKGDPREGSNGFYLKYGVFYYDEILKE